MTQLVSCPQLELFELKPSTLRLEIDSAWDLTMFDLPCCRYTSQNLDFPKLATDLNLAFENIDGQAKPFGPK